VFGARCARGSWRTAKGAPPLAPSLDDMWKEASSPQPSPPEEEREHRRERLGRVVAQTPGQWGAPLGRRKEGGNKTLATPIDCVLREALTLLAVSNYALSEVRLSG